MRRNGLNYKTVKSIKLIVVDKRDWTVKLFSRIFPLEASPVDIGDEPLNVGSEIGCSAVITLLGKIIGRPFNRVITTIDDEAIDDSYYFAIADCCPDKIHKLYELIELHQECELRRRLAVMGDSLSPYPMLI